MKLRNKSLIIIGLTCILLIGCILISPIELNAIHLSILILAFSGITYLLLYRFIISRVETINRDDMTTPLHGEDEPAMLYQKLKELQKNMQQANDTIEKRVSEQMQTLQQVNFKLHQEISEMNTLKEDISNVNAITSDRHDEITGLPNKFYFNDILNKAINSSRRRNQLLAILTVNLNAFKEVNNAVGIKKANEVLKEIANRFTHALRAEDIVSKLDGDEFIILLTDIGQAKFAGAVAEKLLRVCNQKIKIDDKEFNLTTGVGISIFPNDGTSLEDLIKAADTALFNAKHETDKPNGSYQFFTKEIDTQAHEYTYLEKELRKAIDNHELTLYYQPKFSIKRGHISGVETLIRWEHPELGLISPAKFIPIAEECGLIMQIGEWILREACAMNKHWQDAGYEHFTVAVNLSPKQFYHPNIDQTISKILRETGLNPQYLELEITEKTAMANTSLAEKILLSLKTTGVHLSLDHFGTGYTSITHLKQFPISAVKIDHSFIKGVPNNPNDSAIASAFIGLAHNLGLEVVAEGVETPEQMQYLTKHGCDIVQGYYLSHPVPAQKVELQFSKLRDEVLL